MFKWLMGVKDGIFVTIMTAFIGVIAVYIWLKLDRDKTSKTNYSNYHY